MQNLTQIQRLSKTAYYDHIRELNERKKILFSEPDLSLEKLSKRFAERIVTTASMPVPDCLTCGLCCAYALCVPVRRDDLTAPEKYWELTMDQSASKIVINRFLKRDDITCDFLGGKLGETVGCQIYESRPQACHDFEAGSDRCHAYRRMYGLESPLTEEEIRIAGERLETNPLERKTDYVLIHEDEIIEKAFFDEGKISSRTETHLLKIYGFFGDETPVELHAYNPAEESWFENDFLALSFDETQELIASRKGSAK